MKLSRIISIAGIIGFFLFTPAILYALGIEAPLRILQRLPAPLNEFSTILLIAYALIIPMLLFGGGDSITPLIVATITGFLLMTTYVETGFMQWWIGLSRHLPFLRNTPLNFLCGIFENCAAGLLL